MKAIKYERTMPPGDHDRVSLLHLLTEMTYPDYRDRHIFTARLRLLILFSFAFFYALVFADVVPPTHPAMLTIGATALATIYCYYNIITAQFMTASLVIEILADMVGITTMIYLLGDIQSDYFLIYCCYCLASGLIYSYRIATTLAICSLVTYGIFYVLLSGGYLPPLTTPAINAAHLMSEHAGWEHPTWMHPVMLAVLLGFAVYAVKSAQRLTWVRERALEARNRELMALQRIGATIRGTTSIEEVADRVLVGLTSGLDLVGCLLLLSDHQRNAMICYPPRSVEAIREVETMLGTALRELTLPLDAPESVVLRQIMERKVVYRRELRELLLGFQPVLPAERLQAVQQHFGIRKTVAIPLVVEGDLIGMLLGFSDESFVGDRAVSTLQIFADQAALVLQVTLLIEQLKTTNQELLEANRVKGEFLATMSHELRTPLTAIIGFSELLLEGAMGPLTEEQLDSLREVRNNGANLLELINNILDLSRMESGRMTLTIEPIDVRELLERTHRNVGSLLARKQHRFTLVVAPDLPPLQGDERRLQQVFLNLLGNAIKFTPEGGAITVTAYHFMRLETLRQLAWRQHLDDVAPFTQGGFAIQVHDTGVGIPKSHLHIIFEMFRQVDSSVTRRYEGTGLGLALVRQLVELHRGVIWAESEAGKGTLFTCLLPATPPTPTTTDFIVETQPQLPAYPAIRMPG
ncbi:MAG: GAF domain-containing protein [Deltaproteobacteria bacterium]|nr:GAF domain-containing protein [Deltaproteobacteria bacterium]